MRLGFEPARAAYPVLVSIQVEPRQQSRIVGRLTGPAVCLRVLETRRLQVQRADKDIDRAHRMMFGHVVVQAGRQKHHPASGLNLPVASLGHRGKPRGSLECRQT